MDLAVIGLGKLGLPSAACFAAVGNEVVGIDLNVDFINVLNENGNPITEPGLDELLDEARSHIRFTTFYEDIPIYTDVYLIIVPTPSGEDDRFANEYVCTAIESLAPTLKRAIEAKHFPVIDVVSTVMPATCDEVFKPLLNKLLGCVCGIDFGLVYNPEFIALGSVVANFQNPDMVLIGASDERSGQIVQQMYEGLLGWPRKGDGTANEKIRCMSLLNAELTKLSLNCSLSMKISIGNFYAILCEQYPGADVDAIAGAVGMDTRIGNKFLRAGLGAGGTCLPRDLRALRTVVPQEYHNFIMQRQVNRWIRNIIIGTVSERLKPKSRIALLGMSFKPDTYVTEESESLLIADALIDAGYDIVWSDPLVPGEAYSAAPKAETPENACKDADAILILTQDKVWVQLPWDTITETTKETLVILDCWRILRTRLWREGVQYRGLGLNL